MRGAQPTTSTSWLESDVFDNIYKHARWRVNASREPNASELHPSSGAGSMPMAARSACVVLAEAVRRIATSPVRILDAPCGDSTWMPACLTRIASEQNVKLVYQGGDIVAELVHQLNAGHGRFLPGGVRPTAGPGVTVNTFVVLDATNVTAMAMLRGSFDVIVTRHVTIHLKSEAVLRIIDGWNAVAPRYVLTDDYSMDHNGNWLDAGHPFPYRELNLREVSHVSASIQPHIQPHDQPHDHKVSHGPRMPPHAIAKLMPGRSHQKA